MPQEKATELQSICVQSILAHPHTLSTITFRPAQHMCKFDFFFAASTPARFDGSTKIVALYHKCAGPQITPKLVLEFKKDIMKSLQTIRIIQFLCEAIFRTPHT